MKRESALQQLKKTIEQCCNSGVLNVATLAAQYEREYWRVKQRNEKEYLNKMRVKQRNERMEGVAKNINDFLEKRPDLKD